MTIRQLKSDEIEEALELSWDVFSDTEAEYYTEEGIRSFYESIHDRKFLDSLDIYGAFINNIMVGIIGTRDNGRHIALFFVCPKFQRNGIGKNLFRHMLEKNKSREMTVNSSRSAIEVYRKFGFTNTACEQRSGGIIYTPMKMCI